MKSYSIVPGAARIATALVVVAALLPGRTNAQVAAGGRTTINTTSAGYLGILKLRCDCTLRVDPDERYRYFSFRTEPIIGAVETGSPADGLLRAGDHITHVDGQPIRSSSGAQKFATIQPGQSVELTIRRDGRTSKARITAAALDWEDYRVLGTLAPEGYAVTWETPSIPPFPSIPGFPSGPAQATPRAPRAPTAGVAPRTPRAPVAPQVWDDVTPAQPTQPPQPVQPAQPGYVSVWPTVPESPVVPTGWFGFSFRCSNCGWSSTGPNGDNPVWESGDSPPELTMISRGGPADRAGLRVGDRMTHLDGVSIASREGARKLGAVRPGQRVRVTVLRDGKSITRALTLGTRPEARAVIAATPRAPTARAAPTAPAAPVAPRFRRELRYTGRLEDVSVEVWSPAGTTVERVGDTMVITVGTSIVRLKVDPKK